MRSIARLLVVLVVLVALGCSQRRAQQRAMSLFVMRLRMPMALCPYFSQTWSPCPIVMRYTESSLPGTESLACALPDEGTASASAAVTMARITA